MQRALLGKAVVRNDLQRVFARRKPAHDAGEGGIGVVVRGDLLAVHIDRSRMAHALALDADVSVGAKRRRIPSLAAVQPESGIGLPTTRRMDAERLAGARALQGNKRPEFARRFLLRADGVL